MSKQLKEYTLEEVAQVQVVETEFPELYIDWILIHSTTSYLTWYLNALSRTVILEIDLFTSG